MLSLVAPGLGQLYNGKVAKAAIFYFVPHVFVATYCFLVRSALSMPLILVTTAIAVAFRIGVVIEAVLQAKSIGYNYVPRKYNRWYVYLIAIICAAAFANSLDAFVSEGVLAAFRVPSESMEPTLLAGDHVLVDLTSVG